MHKKEESTSQRILLKNQTKLDREEILLNDQLAWTKLGEMIDRGGKAPPQKSHKWNRVKACLSKQMKDKNMGERKRKEMIPLVFDQLMSYY